MDRKKLMFLILLDYNKQKIAQEMGVSRRTLYAYLKKNPITREEAEQCVYQNEQPQEKLADNKPKVKEVKEDNTGSVLPSNWSQLSKQERADYLNSKLQPSIDDFLNDKWS